MPTRNFRSYRRRVRRSRTMGSRKPTYRRRPMTAGKVKRIIDAELKVKDHSIGPAIIPHTTGVVFHISAVGQGDANDERNGNWIKPTTFMGTITVEGTEAAADDIVPRYRVGVLVWKENQDINILTMAKILQNTVDPHQQYNIENKGQFKILWSRTGILSNTSINPQFQKIHRFYVKPSMKILFDDADFKNNHLFLFALSDVDVANNPPSITFSARLRYTDS